LNSLRFHQNYKGVFEGASTIQRSLDGAFKWIKLTTTNDTSDLVVIGNFGVTVASGSVAFPTAGTWYDLFANTTFSATGGEQNFNLNPGDFRVFVNRNVNNLTTTPVNNVPWTGATLEAKLFPNPVRANYTVELAVPQSGTVTVDLYNSTGQFITSVYNGFLQKGKRQLPLQRPAVVNGTYFLRLQLKGETKTIPLTIQ
jgi:hypothetical protein